MGVFVRTTAAVALATSLVFGCTTFDSENEGADAGAPVDASSLDAEAGASDATTDQSEFASPVPLAIALAEPLTIAMDATSVFYPNAAASEIRASTFAAPKERVVAQGAVEVGDIVLDGARVYWSAVGANGGCSGGNRGLFSVLKDATGYKKIYDACSRSVRLGGETSSLVMTTKEQQLWRVAKDGTSGTGDNDALFGASNPSAVASNGSALFWTSLTNGTISTDDGTKVPRLIANGQSNPIDILAEGKVLYWLTATGVMRLDTSTAPPTPTVLAADQGGPFRMAADMTHLFWTNRGDGSIASVPKTGGAVRKLFTNRGEPAAIAVSAGGIAWSELVGGKVMFAARK